MSNSKRRIGLALPAVCALPLVAPAADPCDQVAFGAWLSCRNEVIADFWLARANCDNLPSFPDRLECRIEALQELAEARAACNDIREARLDLCAALGGGYYAPEIDPEDFVDVIDNPYLSYLPGTTFIYRKDFDKGTEIITVTVSDKTTEILGVECTVVHDVVALNGDVIEDTFDWYAQDKDGNVWYFGEISAEYEDGELVGFGGSWKAGVDSAHPGIVMKAAPMPGDVYRQEFLLREAEDWAAVVSLNEKVIVPFGAYGGCLQTEEGTPLDPEVLEYKYYAPGVGLVLEVDPEAGERTELIGIRVN